MASIRPSNSKYSSVVTVGYNDRLTQFPSACRKPQLLGRQRSRYENHSIDAVEMALVLRTVEVLKSPAW
jgi:hypothetical protein